MSNEAESNLPGQAVSPAPQIENIEIIELLGKGGMSLVYKARQEQLDRIVAVKVLSKSALRGEGGIKRFQKEAKLTSSLEHPNIVKTISFGVSQDGQPYLVMEYLEGLSLADDLKQNGRLNLQKFKDVFLPALSALDRAHQAGVIHRDLKPGNIMICRSHTGAETVKMVDFGIAKVYGEGASETDQLTKSGVVVGSPAYMSPEQCQGQPLDGRSDLYSMACMMYEALSGEPPFSGDSLFEVMQKHSVEPPPTVSDLSRKIDIRKELAAVTLWGLAKDPAARPQTAAEFARKLNEVLEKITLDKVPRLKAAAASSRILSIAVVLLGISIMIACMAFVLDQQNGQAKKNAFKAMSVNPQQKEELRYKHLLAKAETAIGLPEELEAIAGRYKNQNDWPHAEALWKRLIEVREKTLGANDLSVADSLDDLVFCYFQEKRYAESEPLLKRALAIREKALKPDNLRVARSLSGLANCYRQSGKHEEALPLAKRALAIRQKALAPNDPLIDESLKQLENCYGDQRRYTEEEKLLKGSLAKMEKDLKANDPMLAASLERLASCYKAQVRYAEEEALLRRALAIREQTLRPNDLMLASFLAEVADCFSRSGKYTEALPFIKRALAIREDSLGPNELGVDDYRKQLARCYEGQGNYVEAEKLLKRSLAIREKAFKPNDPKLADSLAELANCYRCQGRFTEAEALLERALTIREKVLLPDDPILAHSLLDIANCYQDQGKYAEVEPLLKRALAVKDKRLVDDHELTEILRSLVNCYNKEGKLAEAKLLLKRAGTVQSKATR